MATLFAVTGADMQPTLDGVPVPLRESVAAEPGQVQAMAFAKLGTRAYIAAAAGIGGMGGDALKPGKRVPTGTPAPGAVCQFAFGDLVSSPTKAPHQSLKHDLDPCGAMPYPLESRHSSDGNVNAMRQEKLTPQI